MNFPLFEHPRWIAADDGPGFDVLEHGRARSDDRAGLDGHAWADEGVGTDPYIIAQYNRRPEKRHVWLRVIVCPGAEMGVLAYSYSIADVDRTEGIKYGMVAHGGIGADRDVPWDGHRYRGPDVSKRMNFGAEATQQPAAQA